MNDEKNTHSFPKDYPDGTLWQNDNSIDENGNADFWIRKNGKWHFFKRDKALFFIKPSKKTDAPTDTCEGIDEESK